VRILTHNVYWFQGHPSRWAHERVAEAPEVLDALALLYASVAADLVCLQEVHRKGLAQRLSQELGMTAWLHASGGLRGDYGGVVLSRGQARLRDCTRPAGRPAHERVHLRAGVEWSGGRLELAAIHLPSNRYAGSAASGDVARVAELERVLAEPPRPNAVVGDMNCLPDSPPYQFMLRAGYVDVAVAAGAVPERRPDYMWLDARCAGRLTGFAVLDDGPFCRRSEKTGPWRLSDHSPLLMELR